MHSYFSPYGNPYEASITYFSVLFDLHYRFKKHLKLADGPFNFSLGPDIFTGNIVWSLEAMVRVLPDVDLESIEYHNRKGDLASWARFSLGDKWLAEEMDGLRGLKGEPLRKRLLDAIGAAQKVGR